MTESEWLKCSDPLPMLDFLRGRAGDRKLRLFAAACSRRVWHWIDDLGRQAVEAAEAFADGLMGPEELRAARLACRSAGERAAWYAAASDPFKAAGNAARSALGGVALSQQPAECAAQADLLRDIIGNPFRPLMTDPIWRTSKVVGLAQIIYDSRAFDRMAGLADALEEAGCDNAAILSHCRQPGEHVRGCWVLDALLGKE
ncbi:MAG TPA: hypothetical protein VNK04_19785 [Gemmataceae bacterium]|nr:hypothetical protein [Gemmataceae bacterium]